MNLSNEQKGIALVIGSAVAYGFLYYFGISIIRENYSPFVTMFWRFLIATIFLFFLVLLKLKKISFFKRETLLPLITSAPFHGTATSLYFVSASLIGGGPAEVLLFTHPITVLIFNRLVYKTHIAKICYIAISCIIFGTILLSDFTHANFNLNGILIGFLASIFFGLYITSSKSNKTDPLISAFMVCFGSIIICLIFTLLHGSFVIPDSPKIWFNVLCLGLICTALPILLFQKGLKFIASEKAEIISMLEPPIVMLVSFIFLSEKITLIQLFGSIIIFASALIVTTKKTS
ncbi:MAG: EamA family transporter [Rickettsiales bacterium]|nr:EamA family transporter [Rickettsiales bacterium]